MQTRNLSAKGTQGNSANGSGKEMTEARLLWEIKQHKKLEERTYAVLSFLAAIMGEHNGDSDLMLDADARQGLQYVLADLRGRVSSAAYGYFDWRGQFYSDKYYGMEKEYEPEQGACHE